MRAIFESAFDAVYLVTVIALGVKMIRQGGHIRQYLLFGVMAVLLGAGDAFHLVPRAYALLTDGLENHAAALGVGKLVTSITMTVFYVLLYHVWRERYQIRGRKGLTALVHGLAVIRVALCAFPQNAWTSADAPVSWGIWRNIPFALLGLAVVLLFARSVRETQDKPFRHMALTIVLSFAFYIPVVLFASVAPWTGMLMIPKTLAYVWTVLIGYRAMKKELAGAKAA